MVLLTGQILALVAYTLLPVAYILAQVVYTVLPAAYIPAQVVHTILPAGQIAAWTAFLFSSVPFSVFWVSVLELVQLVL